MKMYIIIYILLSIFPSYSKACRGNISIYFKNFLNNVDIAVFDEKQIFNQESIEDSVSFSYEIDEPTKLIVYLNSDFNKQYIFWIKGEANSIIIDSTSEYIQVLNSTINNDYIEWMILSKPIQIELHKIIEDLNRNSIKDSIIVIDNRFKKTNEIYIQQQYQFMKSHTKSFLTLDNIRFYLGSKQINFDSLKILFYNLDTSLYKYRLWSLCNEFINSNRKLYKEGDTLSPTFLYTVNDKLYNLANIQTNKKYIYLYFWASNCGPCIMGVNKLKEIVLNNSDVELIGISQDQHKNHWINFINLKNEIWLNFCDFKGMLSPIFSEFNIQGIPTGVLMDQYKRIIKIDIKPDDINKYVK